MQGGMACCSACTSISFLVVLGWETMPDSSIMAPFISPNRFLVLPLNYYGPATSSYSWHSLWISVYCIQFQGQIKRLNITPIWKAKTEPKCRIFAWILLHRKILTANNLAKRGWVGLTILYASYATRSQKHPHTCATTVHILRKCETSWSVGSACGLYLRATLRPRFIDGGKSVKKWSGTKVDPFLWSRYLHLVEYMERAKSKNLQSRVQILRGSGLSN